VTLLSGPPAGASARLQLEAISKRYGDVQAVDQVDLDIAPGEFVTLLGPSGSGKTTTLMVIAGFQAPTSGHVLLNGARLTDTPAYERGFGIVFQNYALFPHMTVSDNIAFPLRMRGVPKSTRASMVEAALDLVRLPGLGARYPSQLSGGQQQRVALARALVFEPPVLLMDEPLGALDKKLRQEMQLEIRRIQQETRTTAIYVTHDQEEALVMSDRLAVMHMGRIEQVGTPADVYENPRSRFVADFVGESNILPVVIRADGSRRWAEIATGVDVPIAAAEIVDGQAGYLVIRPEQVTVMDSGTGGGADIRIGGEVEEVIYLGDSTKVAVRLGTGQKMVARVAPSHDAVLQDGQRVAVGWNPRDARLVSD
jgi:spermidine/putrescine ABC transporter ATP-binding subunit